MCFGIMIVVYFIVSNCFRKKDQTCFSKQLSKHVLKPSPAAKSLDNTAYNFKIGNHCNTRGKPEAVKNLCCKINRISLKNITTSETMHKTVAVRSSTEVRCECFPTQRGEVPEEEGNPAEICRGFPGSTTSEVVTVQTPHISSPCSFVQTAITEVPTLSGTLQVRKTHDSDNLWEELGEHTQKTSHCSILLGGSSKTSASLTYKKTEYKLQSYIIIVCLPCLQAVIHTYSR